MSHPSICRNPKQNSRRRRRNTRSRNVRELSEAEFPGSRIRRSARNRPIRGQAGAVIRAPAGLRDPSNSGPRSRPKPSKGRPAPKSKNASPRYRKPPPQDSSPKSGSLTFRIPLLFREDRASAGRAEFGRFRGLAAKVFRFPGTGRRPPSLGPPGSSNPAAAISREFAVLRRIPAISRFPRLSRFPNLRAGTGSLVRELSVAAGSDPGGCDYQLAGLNFGGSQPGRPGFLESGTGPPGAQGLPPPPPLWKTRPPAATLQRNPLLPKTRKRAQPAKREKAQTQFRVRQKVFVRCTRGAVAQNPDTERGGTCSRKSNVPKRGRMLSCANISEPQDGIYSLLKPRNRVPLFSSPLERRRPRGFGPWQISARGPPRRRVSVSPIPSYSSEFPFSSTAVAARPSSNIFDARPLFFYRNCTPGASRKKN